MAIPQVGAVGLTFRFTVKDQDQAVVDLRAATAITLFLRRPDGRVKRCFIGTGSAQPSAMLGEIEYVTVSGDLDLHGDWKIQLHFVTGSSTDYWTDVQPLRVAENIAP